MKKVFALAFALAGTTAAFAQGQTSLGIGVKVGGTYSNVSGDNVQQLTGPGYSSDLGDYKLGYNAGLTFNLPVSSDGFFSIAPEILYNRKGYEIQSEQTTGLASNVSKVEIEQQRVLHYIDVPVMARINAGGLFFEVGPQVSYLFGSKNKSETTTKYRDGTKDKVEENNGFRDYTGISRDEAYKSDLSQFDISGVAGVGYMIPDAGISLNLRYARGFNSLIDSKDADNEPKAFNNAFTLQLGYLLPLGR
ncbi:porin family protein [Solirubrum puertoriconensis]|uniref:Outer membrane protein beta-barrel domain-containing protein n=1 Tax=Solirubrum puertoriconensis TaxID=1751427 RepID=A0A9X0L3C8_SOLP1|nr:porin family protein [Solirubrum puertoriconensis]KUG06351.1 hypothetical protein ASU33_03055 [Solirubrum puertoriconensis]